MGSDSFTGRNSVWDEIIPEMDGDDGHTTL